MLAYTKFTIYGLYIYIYYNTNCLPFPWNIAPIIKVFLPEVAFLRALVVDSADQLTDPGLELVYVLVDRGTTLYLDVYERMCDRGISV